MAPPPFHGILPKPSASDQQSLSDCHGTQRVSPTLISSKSRNQHFAFVLHLAGMKCESLHVGLQKFNVSRSISRNRSTATTMVVNIDSQIDVEFHYQEVKLYTYAMSKLRNSLKAFRPDCVSFSATA